MQLWNQNLIMVGFESLSKCPIRFKSETCLIFAHSNYYALLLCGLPVEPVPVVSTAETCDEDKMIELINRVPFRIALFIYSDEISFPAVVIEYCKPLYTLFYNFKITVKFSSNVDHSGTIEDAIIASSKPVLMLTNECGFLANFLLLSSINYTNVFSYKSNYLNYLNDTDATQTQIQ